MALLERNGALRPSPSAPPQHPQDDGADDLFALNDIEEELKQLSTLNQELLDEFQRPDNPQAVSMIDAAVGLAPADAEQLELLRLENAELLRAAHDYRFGFLVAAAGPPAAPPLRLTGDPVGFSCLKGAEDGDGVIFRLYNPGHAAAQAGIETEAALTRVRLDETDERLLEGSTMTLAAGEIATLRLRRTVSA